MSGGRVGIYVWRELMGPYDLQAIRFFRTIDILQSFGIGP